MKWCGGEMKLTDEQGNEYEFETHSHTLDFEKDDNYKVGTLKPVDSKEFWYINQYGAVYSKEDDGAFDYEKTFDFTGVYRTKEEAEYAVERVRSLQEIDPTVEAMDNHILVSFYLPKKYLKSWKELSDD